MPVLKVKQNNEWVNVGSISGGITVDTENSNIGTPNGINADTLGGNTLQQIMLAMYPVGAIYMSANAVSPADLFGGTWERIEDRFLLAAGSSYTAGSTGGESGVTLKANHIPRIPVWSDKWGGDYHLGHSASASDPPANPGFAPTNGFTGGTGYTRANTLNVGTSSPKEHNNMPPYLSVYIWKRIA